MTLIIRFAPAAREGAATTYHVDLDSPEVGQAHGDFVLPFAPTTQVAIQQALAPNFVLAEADAATQAALQALGPLSQLHQQVGEALGQALCASPDVASLFNRALGLATGQRQSLPVELRFGAGCDAVAALPWELLRYEGRFLVADTSIALSRYPEGLLPPTLALADLPLRVLLVLSEPLDASPIFPQQARAQLLHGLRALDEEGAVIVDLLQPPTFDTLVEAVRNGHYHLLIFYGHGVHGPDGGQLLFEDNYGAGALIRATDLGAALRNTAVRLVVLGACQSATVGEGSIWQGTAAALVQAGVPLALGMQVSMRVDAAQSFLRQFALSLAAGKPIIDAVADGRVPLIQRRYGESWFTPALYGRPAGKGDDAQRLFDRSQSLPPETADLRTEMKGLRSEIDQLERTVQGVGSVGQVGEIAKLRSARQRFADLRFQLAQQTTGGYASVTSPLYGVPDNPIFVGRSSELIEVGQYLEQEQPVVIWGPGGLGKSALAMEVAHRQSWHYPAGVLWLDCRGGPALDTLLDQIGAFCGLENLEQTPPEKKVTVVRAALARLENRCLLIWDNAENVWDDRSIRRFVRQELPDNCQLLLTTRNDPDEAMWPTVELQPLADSIMQQLFFILAGAAQVKIGGQADLDVIDPMLAWLEGHPLAVTLLVPLAKRRGLRTVWADLQQRPLKGIDAAFAVSYERLTNPQQQLFTRLSVFTIPFERNAGAAMLADVTNDNSNVEDDLDMLQQRALLQWTGERCTFHALLRQFAYARLQEWEEDVRTIHRLAAEYLQFIYDQRARTPEEGLEEVDQWERAEEWKIFASRTTVLMGSLDRLGYWSEIEARLLRAQDALSAHHNNDIQSIKQKVAEIRSSGRRIDNPQDIFQWNIITSLAAELLNHLGIITYKQARWNDALGYHEQALRMFEGIGSKKGMANAYNGLGNAYQKQGDRSCALKHYEQALNIFEDVDDHHGMAATWVYLASIYQSRMEWEKALDYYEKAQKAFEELGSNDEIAVTLGHLGIVYERKKEWDRAIEYYKNALEIDGQLGNTHGLAINFSNLGNAYKGKGEWQGAIECYQQALEKFEQTGDALGMAHTWANWGNIYQNRGERTRAIDHHMKALKLFVQVDDIYAIATTYTNLGVLCNDTGDWKLAINYCKQALEIYEQVEDNHGVAQTYNNLGNIYESKGEWDQAIDWYEKALKIFDKAGDFHGLATIYGGLGIAYQGKGQWELAVTHNAQALVLFEKLEDSHGMAKVCGNLGNVYSHKQEWTRAVNYYEQALKLFEKLGDNYGIATVHDNLGDILRDQGEWGRAIKHYERSLNGKVQVNDVYGMASAYGKLGLIYQSQQEWERAIDCYRQSLHGFEQIGESQKLAATYGSLGVIFHSQEIWDQAIKYYEQALQILEKLEDACGVAETVANLGYVYHCNEKWESAVIYYERARQMFGQSGSLSDLAVIVENLGSIYQRKENWNLSIDCYKQVLKIKEQMADLRGVAFTYGKLGLVYGSEEKWDYALESYEQALQTFKQVEDNHGIAITCGALGTIYQNKGEWKRAINFYADALHMLEQLGDSDAIVALHAQMQSCYYLQNLQNVDFLDATQAYRRDASENIEDRKSAMRSGRRMTFLATGYLVAIYVVLSLCGAINFSFQGLFRFLFATLVPAIIVGILIVGYYKYTSSNVR